MTQEALKMALEALKRATNYDPVIARAITAIKEALAQPTSGDYAHGYVEGFNDACMPKPPQRKPLTDEQIVPMFSQRQKQQTEGEKDEWYFYAWGVSDGEAAHGIKE